jgi:plasmid stabilization system protein ParE
MTIRWARSARQDLERLHGFMESVSPARAVAIVDALIAGVERLAELPRVGQRLTRYSKREVRRVFVGDYEVRYELKGSNILVVRLWHTREDR